jgi:hypothetical protein
LTDLTKLAAYFDPASESRNERAQRFGQVKETWDGHREAIKAAEQKASAEKVSEENVADTPA